jgi:hypothetical protein
MARVYSRRYPGVPEDAVPIERGTDWGNPFRVGVHGSRQQVLAKYRDWLLGDPELVRKAREELAGRDLVCCCKPKPCHGDILLAVANACL